MITLIWVKLNEQCPVHLININVIYAELIVCVCVVIVDHVNFVLSQLVMRRFTLNF